MKKKVTKYATVHEAATAAVSNAYGAVLDELRATYDEVREPLNALGLPTPNLDHAAHAMDRDARAREVREGQLREHAFALDEAKTLVKENLVKNSDADRGLFLKVVKLERLVNLDTAYSDARFALVYPDTHASRVAERLAA